MIHGREIVKGWIFIEVLEPTCFRKTTGDCDCVSTWRKEAIFVLSIKYVVCWYMRIILVIPYVRIKLIGRRIIPLIFFFWLMHLENWFETNVFYIASLRLLICLDYSCIHIVLSMKCYFNEMVIHFSMNNTKKQIVEIHSQFNPVNTTRNKPTNTRNATHRYRKKIQKNYPNLVSKPWSKPWSKLMKRHHLIVQAKERKKRIRDPKQEEASRPHLLFPPSSRGGGKMANNGDKDILNGGGKARKTISNV